MTTLALIDLVRKHRYIYDKLDPLYQDSDKKHEAWLEIGQQLNIDAATCKSRWSNIRDQFRKCMKKPPKTHAGTQYMSLYKYHEHLTFLIPCFNEDFGSSGSFKTDHDDTMDGNSETVEESVDVKLDLPVTEVTSREEHIDKFLEGIAPTLSTVALIDLVRKHRFIYDKSDPLYQDSNKKHDTWLEIGRQLNIDAATCKSRWNNIRDQFRKSMKKPPKNPASKYKYYDHLTFLIPCFNEDFDSGVWPSGTFKTENKDNDDTMDGSSETVEETADIAPILPVIEQVTSREDHIDKFLEGISPTLKSLTPLEQNRAKSEIFQIVQKYEMQMLTRQQGVQVKWECG